jgi:hypothetical protein
MAQKFAAICGIVRVLAAFSAIFGQYFFDF